MHSFWPHYAKLIQMRTKQRQTERDAHKASQWEKKRRNERHGEWFTYTRQCFSHSAWQRPRAFQINKYLQKLFIYSEDCLRLRLLNIFIIIVKFLTNSMSKQLLMQPSNKSFSLQKHTTPAQRHSIHGSHAAHSSADSANSEILLCQKNHCDSHSTDSKQKTNGFR